MSGLNTPPCSPMLTSLEVCRMICFGAPEELHFTAQLACWRRLVPPDFGGRLGRGVAAGSLAAPRECAAVPSAPPGAELVRRRPAWPPRPRCAVRRGPCYGPSAVVALSRSRLLASLCCLFAGVSVGVCGWLGRCLGLRLVRRVGPVVVQCWRCGGGRLAFLVRAASFS